MRYLFVFIYFSCFSFAQSIGGLATYSFLPKNNDEIENLLKEDDPYELNKKMLEASTKLEVKLMFNVNRSCFYVENPEKDSGIKLASALYLNITGKTFTDLNRKKLLFNNSEGFFKKNKYVVTDSLHTNWILTNDTKQIDNYKCYKATLTHSVKSRKGNVTAWYCPEIPYSFGPKGYGGLPGLIVELIDKRGVIGLKTLSLNVPIDEKVLDIKGEEEISSEEYQKLVEKLIFDE